MELKESHVASGLFKAQKPDARQALQAQQIAFIDDLTQSLEAESICLMARDDRKLYFYKRTEYVTVEKFITDGLHVKNQDIPKCHHGKFYPTQGISLFKKPDDKQTRYFIANSDIHGDECAWTHKKSGKKMSAYERPLKYFIKDAMQSIQVVRLCDDLNTLKQSCRQALQHLQVPLSGAMLTLLTTEDEHRHIHEAFA